MWNLGRATGNTIKRDAVLFACILLFGILVHGQAFLWNADATDAIRAYGSTQAQISSGRFIGHVLDVVFEHLGYYQPFRYINVLLYLIFAAASAVVLLKIFAVRHIAVCLLIGFVIMSSAMISGTLAYFYVAHMYGFSLFLSILGSYLLLKKRMCLSAAVLFVLSLGIYQAYLPTVVLVIFLYQLFQLSDGKVSVREWLLTSFQYALVVLGALCIYIFLNKIYLAQVGFSMSGYANMSENVLPSYGAAQILSLILKSYAFFFGLPFTNQYFLGDNTVMRIFLGACQLCLILQLVFAFFQIKDCTKRLIFAVLVLALPCFINLPMFMQPEVGERLSLNWYFVLILPLLFLEQFDLWNGRAYSVPVFLTLLSVSCAGAVAYNVYRNVTIYSSYAKTHELAEHIVQDLEGRFAACEGFRLEDEVVFVGTLDTLGVNQYFFNIEYGEFLNKVFNRDHSSIFQRYAVQDYNILIPDDARIQKLPVRQLGAEQGELSKYDFFCVTGIHGGHPTIHSGNEQIRKMPSYPDAGCVKKIDGLLVCKLSD